MRLRRSWRDADAGGPVGRGGFMLQKLMRFRYIWMRGGALVATVMLLAGCASTLSARVTTYQQWPDGVEGQTYRLVREPAQGNNLEYDTFADMVRASIGPTGLVEAASGKPARFDVLITYGNPVTQAWAQRYADPYVGYGGFWPYWGGYYGGGWGGGVYMAPPVVSVPVQVYKNSLTVSIKDNQKQGAEVYRSSAVSMSSSENLSEVMPYLAQAVFDGFPGNNGQTRNVTYERRSR